MYSRLVGGGEHFDVLVAVREVGLRQQLGAGLLAVAVLVVGRQSQEADFVHQVLDAFVTRFTALHCN